MRIQPLPLKQSLLLAVLSLEAEAEREPERTPVSRELLGASLTLRDMIKVAPMATGKRMAKNGY